MRRIATCKSLWGLNVYRYIVTWPTIDNDRCISSMWLFILNKKVIIYGTYTKDRVHAKWNKNSKILFFLLIHVYCEAYIILFHIVILYTCKKKKIPFYHTIYFTVIWDFGGFIWRIKIKYLLECTKNIAKKIVAFVKQAFRKTL